MQLGEVYKLKNKSNHYLRDKILISRFASKHIEINGESKINNIIIADSFTDDSMLYSSPIFCQYFDNSEEILKDYELYMSQKEFEEYLNQFEEII